jgi:hypothetical protein
VRWCVLDSSGTRYGQAAFSYECANEHLDSIKCDEFIDQLTDYFSRKSLLHGDGFVGIAFIQGTAQVRSALKYVTRRDFALLNVSVCV